MSTLKSPMVRYRTLKTSPSRFWTAWLAVPLIGVVPTGQPVRIVCRPGPAPTKTRAALTQTARPRARRAMRFLLGQSLICAQSNSEAQGRHSTTPSEPSQYEKKPLRLTGGWLGVCWRRRFNANKRCRSSRAVERPTSAFLKLNNAVFKSKKRVIVAAPDVLARVVLRSPLTNKNAPCGDVLSSKAFDPKPLTLGITTELCGASGFCMRHARKLILYAEWRIPENFPGVKRRIVPDI